VPPGAARTLEFLYAPFFPTDGATEGLLVLTPVVRDRHRQHHSRRTQCANVHDRRRVTLHVLSSDGVAGAHVGGRTMAKSD